jgi:hypothetical protein
VIGGDVDIGLALPTLPGGDAARHAHAPGDGERDGSRRRRIGRRGARHRLEGGHDQRVAGQQRQRLAIGGVHRGLAATRRRVVETGHVVMDQRRAMQQFERHRGGVAQAGIRVSAGAGDGQQQLGADPPAARKDRMAQGRGELRRRSGAFSARHRRLKRHLDPVARVHRALLLPIVRRHGRCYCQPE